MGKKHIYKMNPQNQKTINNLLGFIHKKEIKIEKLTGGTRNFV